MLPHLMTSYHLILIFILHNHLNAIQCPYGSGLWSVASWPSSFYQAHHRPGVRGSISLSRRPPAWAVTRDTWKEWSFSKDLLFAGFIYEFLHCLFSQHGRCHIQSIQIMFKFILPTSVPNLVIINLQNRRPCGFKINYGKSSNVMMTYDDNKLLINPSCDFQQKNM